SLQLAMKDAERMAAAIAPISRMLIELLEAAVAADSLKVTDTRRAALLIQQTVMYSWLMNRFVQSPRTRVTAEDAWEFCLPGPGGGWAARALPDADVLREGRARGAGAAGDRCS